MTSNILRANIPAPARRLIPMALAPLLVWAAHPARALECGDTITSDDPASLHGDIQCSGPELPDAALTIIGPVSVNLKGVVISCGAAITGIEIQGDHARVLNGKVEDCEDGIDVRGDGYHELRRLTVQSTQDQVGNRGFRVRSDQNLLINNRARGFNGEGFRVVGNDNRLENNRATGNADHGFRVSGDDDASSNNLLTRNFSRNNAGEGFKLRNSGNNRLVANVAIRNQDEGFRIQDDAQGNTLIRNRALQNGTTDNEAGIRIQGDGNTLRHNAFLGNCGDGILVTFEAAEEESEEDQAAENNTIIGNVALRNGLDKPACQGDPGVHYDLNDQNAGCDNNRWSGNQFSTRSQNCID